MLSRTVTGLRLTEVREPAMQILGEGTPDRGYCNRKYPQVRMGQDVQGFVAGMDLSLVKSLGQA